MREVFENFTKRKEGQPILYMAFHLSRYPFSSDRIVIVILFSSQSDCKDKRAPTIPNQRTKTSILKMCITAYID
ncbi:hypothetical protein D7V86_11625 [bacterium D16-51]|nr:hypothetical protein D7V96_13480 [bacterium D16-59]RKI59664.1 hypothetical protein D7V86_11625 [bacterium D16-51]